MKSISKEEKINSKQTVEFAVETKEGIVQRIGKSSVLVPNTNFKGGEIRWFDDSQLIKAQYR